MVQKVHGCCVRLLIKLREDSVSMRRLLCLSCLVFLAFLVVASLGSTASAATYYVATNGDDSNPGTEALPWATITKAASTLVAGDTVYVKEGTYSEIVSPVNSGTEGNYITYAAYPGHTVINDLNGVSTNFWDAGFVTTGKSYIKVSGFQIKNCTGGFGLLAQENSHHIIFENNYTYNTYNSGIGAWYSNDIIIDNNEVELACNDGYQECISSDNSYNVEITNNHIHHSGPGSKGGEGIDVKYGSHDVLVKGNYVHDINRLGIYTDSWRAHTYNITIDSNVVHDCIHYGFAIAAEKGVLLSEVTLINNISYHNKHAGFAVGDWDGGQAHPMENISCINNTFYNNGWTVEEGGQDWGCGIDIMEPKGLKNLVIRNNIISDNLSATIVDSNGTSEVHVDHNLIDGYAGHPEENIGTDYVMGDPLFVDPENNDLHIQSGSPAIDMGSSVNAPDHDMDGDARPDNDLWDMGADEYLGGPQAPTADFEGSPLSGDAPLTVNFTDLSTQSPTSWSWTFGDGGSSSAQDPSHQYTDGGDFTVSLEACNAQGCDTETKPDYVSVTGPQAPVADFSGNPLSGDVPLTVYFSDLSSESPTSWSWTFGDGGSSSAQNPSHDYTSGGDYTVSLEACNAVGCDTETKPDYVSATEPGAPVADFSGSPLSGYAPLDVDFTDLSTENPTSWSWTFGDGGTSGAQNPSHQYTAVNTYTVSLEACNATGCDTETKVDYIDVQDQPSQSCHVGSIELSEAKPPKYRAEALITIHDQDCAALAGVTVSVEWYHDGELNKVDSDVTDENGQVTFIDWQDIAGVTHECCVTDLSKTGYPYASGDNHETCDSIVLP